MLADEIKKFFHGDVATDDAMLHTFSHDYSILKVKPKIVVFPKDVDDIKNLVIFVAKKKKAGEDISLTARSAGTDMTGGPLTQSIVISFTPPHGTGQVPYFNEIKEITNDSVTVQPGVYFRDLEKKITEKGLLYPAYPASKDLCAIGGMVSNNSGGEKTLAYGKTENYVRELTVVLADGNVHTLRPLKGKALQTKLKERGFEGSAYRALYKLIQANQKILANAKPDVSKNSAGYYLWNVWDGSKSGTFDINKLLVGSQGTLGIVVEAKLGLVPLPKYSRVGVIFLQNLAWVGDLVEMILKFKPESIESYDDKTLEVAVKLWWPLLRMMKGNVLKLAWDFIPEAMMVLRNGMPKMVLIVEFSGDDDEALKQRLITLKNAIRDFEVSHRGVLMRILKNKEEAEKYWTIRHQSFALLHGAIKDKDAAPFIEDFIVKPEYMHEVLPKVNAILDAYKKDLLYTIAGHPGNGNFHIIPLMDLHDPRVRALIPEISEKIYKLIMEYHGSITAEHNDGLIRTPYLATMYSPKILQLFAKTKKIFDPLDIFNPGKKVNGNLKYTVSHIAPTRE